MACFSPDGRGITHSASRDRLERLIEERAKPGADRAEIDKRIWDLLGQRRAVMFTDLSGFCAALPSSGSSISCNTPYDLIKLFVLPIEVTAAYC